MGTEEIGSIPPQEKPENVQRSEEIQAPQYIPLRETPEEVATKEERKRSDASHLAEIRASLGVSLAEEKIPEPSIDAPQEVSLIMPTPEEVEATPEVTPKPEIVEKRNPNSISELVGFNQGDLLTSPDKVYRSISGRGAIDDLNESGVVRNKQSAGLTKSRWGDRVFWSKGVEGKHINVSEGGHVIEAPLSVAEERVVRKDDITGIYTKNNDGKIFDLLKQEQQKE